MIFSFNQKPAHMPGLVLYRLSSSGFCNGI